MVQLGIRDNWTNGLVPLVSERSFPPAGGGGGGGGGGTPLYRPYRYVPPQREGFLRRFGLITGLDFAHFSLETGMVFEGTTGVRYGF